MGRMIISVLFFLIGCSNSKSHHYFERPILKKIAQLSLIDPPPAVISFTPVYILNINDSISESGFVQLQDVYNTFYIKDYAFFYDFLFDVLNQKIRLDTKSLKTYLYYSQTFSIEPNVSRLYQEKGINGLMNEHCHYKNGFYTLNKKALTLNEINSISYYFFINQYVRADDDVEASIKFKKLNSYLN